jgi:2'-5' RNA ligase
MAAHRLFVAATPPAAVRAALIGAMGGIPGARWQTDDQLHITLRFIGAVDRHQAEDIAVALDRVRSPALTLELGVCGTFERQGRIDTLWIGLRPCDRIKPLHDSVDRALTQAGIPPDARAFPPHVTLARITRAAAPAPDVAQRIMVPARPPFRLERFALYESHLGADGATYEAIAHYPLGG